MCVRVCDFIYAQCALHWYEDARSSIGRRVRSVTKLRLEQFGGVLVLFQQRLQHQREIVIPPKVGNLNFLLCCCPQTLVSIPYLKFTSISLVAPKAAQRLRAPRGTFAEVSGAVEALEAGADAFFARSCSYTPAEVRKL